MINNFNDEKIVGEIKSLLNEVGKVKEEIDVYCDLMKQMFLLTSTKN